MERKMMDRRDFLRGGVCAAALAVGARAAAAPQNAAGGNGLSPLVPDWAYDTNRGLRMRVPGLARKLSFWVAGDTHFALRDERDAQYADFYKRMGQWGAPKAPFEKMLADARAKKPDLLVLTGDNVSFPTLANVEYLHHALATCGVPWIYVSGNHDWHFEGDAGSDLEQRARWTKDRLAPLYQGADPLMASRVVNGVRLVMIDNSAYHVLPEQVAFWKREAAKGEPVCLFMHIPFWQPGWSVCTCACPTWGAATDPYWEIERRQRWAAKLMPSTFEFRDAVFATPNLVGVFAGHIHHFQAATTNGKPCFTTPSNRNGAVLPVVLEG